MRRASMRCRLILRGMLKRNCPASYSSCCAVARSTYASRLSRDRAEELRSIHEVRLRKAGSGERLRNAMLWLPGVDSEAEHHDATTLEHAPYLPQPSARIRPRLHRIDRERLVERLVGERQPFR